MVATESQTAPAASALCRSRTVAPVASSSARVASPGRGRARGRERWWRTVPTDHREPDYDSLSPQERAALDEWRAAQIPGELSLVDRFIRDHRKHGRWAKAARAGGYYTAEGLDALLDEFIALLNKYGHTARDAPPGARLMQLRMFYIPDEPPSQE